MTPAFFQIPITKQITASKSHDQSKANYKEIITTIEETKKLDEATEELLKKAIPECVENFGTTHTLVTPKEA